jgi:uncharacterized peroxidase-related enzyme
MAFTGVVSEADAGPRLKQLYQQIAGQMGFLPNYFLALGRAPEMIEAQLALALALAGQKGLSEAAKERIGLVVSGLNTSSYCIAAHMELLRTMGVEKAVSRKLATNYPAAPVEEKEQVLYRLADKLTRKPADFGQADVEAARAAGWDDQAIWETVLAVSFYNFINRVSIGLGVVADF